MRKRQNAAYRGLYGPHPKAAIPPALLWRERIRAWAAALHCALAPDRYGKLRRAAADDAALLADAQRHLAFPLLAPTHVPAGYRLDGVETVPHCDDLLTLTYQAEPGKSFCLSQRKQWLPLAEELKLARVAHTAVKCGSVRVFLVHGVHVGEPIDHSYSARYRRSVAVETGGLVCELREIICQGPGLRSLIALARALAQQSGEAESVSVGRSARIGRALLPSFGIS
jgi:hypothetical protein